MSEGRKFTSWQGQDLTPEYDFTEPTSEVHVIWEEVEVGGRAWKGEADVGTVPIRDERGRTGNPANLPSGLGHVSLAAHNRWRWTENNGSNTMARGWIGPKDYMRDLEGGLRADRYREVRMSVLDANEQLKGVIVDANRPPEGDTTRVEWVRTTYLDGSPDPTRVIADTYISGSNVVNLPAQRVYGDPRSILAEIASFANKEVFVTVDEELFYDGWDSEVYAAGLRISDRIDEITVGESSEGASSVRLYPSSTRSGSGAGEAFDAPDLGTAEAAAGWDDTITEFDAFYMYDSPAGTASGTAGSWSSVDAPAADIGLHLLVHVLDGDLLSLVQNGGVILGQHRMRSRSGIGISEASQQNYSNFAARVYRPGTGFVATLVDVGDSVGTVKFLAATGGRNASFGPVTFTPYASAVDGDYLVIDIGLSHVAPTSGGTGATLFITDNAGSDLPIDNSTTTALNSWWQLGPPEDALPTFPPIWDVGPASTEDGQQLLSGLRMYYGAGSNTYVYVSDPTTANQYAHYEESLYAPESITTAAAATTLANSVLARRKYEDRNINVSIGPLDETQVGLVKYGQLIDIKARAISYADDQFFTGRIRQLRWTTPVPGMFFAHMQIERPIKELPYGVGNRSGSEAVSAHVLQGSNAHPEFVLRATLTTPGDLPYRGASDWTRLAIGASNTHLISDGITPLWRSNTGGGGGATDHGALTGLTDDDHPQYRMDVTLGSITAGGSPVTIDNDADHKAFPGLCRLDESRVLLVYRNGTAHLTAGNIVGRIGTLAANRESVSSWGSEFTVLNEADDLRLQDAVAVIDGRVVISFRRYDGTDNHDPALLISDVMATDVTSSSTWTTVEITLTEGNAQNYTSGHMVKLDNGRYLQPYGSQDSGSDHIVGVLLSDSLTDWTAPTVVNVGTTADFSEIAVEKLPDGRLVALLRNDDTDGTYRAISSNHGATWTAPSSSHDGAGFPAFRLLLSGNSLTVYRDSPDGDNAWRVSTDNGLAWGTETILDTTGTRSTYATLLQLTPEKILCVYACEGAGGSSATDSDLYSQIFTDASTGYTYHDELANVTPDQHHAQQHKIDGSDHWTDETDTSLVLKPDGVGGVEWGTDATGAGGGATAVQASSVTGGGAGNLTNATTGSWTDVTSASITFTTQARKVKLGFTGSAANDNASAITSFTFDVDGTPQGGTLGLMRDQMDGTASRFRNVSFTFMTDTLSAASHTFKVQWRVSAGTSTLLNASASAVWHFWAEECPT